MGSVICLVGLVIMGVSLVFVIATKGKRPIAAHLIAAIGQTISIVGLALYF